jgi:hypothetical protein
MSQDLDMQTDALLHRYVNAAVPLTSDRRTWAVTRKGVQFRLYLLAAFPRVAPAIFLPSAGGQQVPLPSSLAAPWDGKTLLPIWLDACFDRVDALCVPYVKPSEFVVPALEPGAAHMVLSDPAQAEALVSTTPLRRSIDFALFAALDDVDRAAADNQALKPSVQAVADRVAALQAEVSERRKRCAELATTLSTSHSINATLASYRMRIADLDTASSAIGDAMLKTPPDDEEHAADEFVASRMAFHAAETKLRAYKASGSGTI